jgi:hypothetical protein
LASRLIGQHRTLDPFDSERRFLLTAAEVDGVTSRIDERTDTIVYDHERPWAYSKTTYFDTRELDYLRTSDGPLRRRLRTREYASARTRDDEPLLSGLCFLELKEAAGAARHKIRLSTTCADLAAIMSSAGHNGVIPRRSQREPAIPQALQDELGAGNLRAQLTTWYRRHSRSAEEGRVRITVDEELCFCRPAPLGAAGQAGCPTHIVGLGPARVLEVKCQGPPPEWLAPLLHRLEEAPSFSKFRAGMALLLEVPAHHAAVRPFTPARRHHAAAGVRPGVSEVALALARPGGRAV